MAKNTTANVTASHAHREVTYSSSTSSGSM